MKKRIISTVLSLSLIMGFSLTALAHDGSLHGDADGAVVGDQDDSGATQFYLRIDKDATDEDGGETTTTEPKDGFTDSTDSRISYTIYFDTTASYQLSVTVPLYVCMYAYGGDGTVVAPGADAYKLVNESSSNDAVKISISAIVKNIAYAQLKDDAIPKPNNGEIVAISYDDATDTYNYFYEEPVDPSIYSNYQNGITGVNTSGSWYVFYDLAANTYDFKTEGSLINGIYSESVADTDTVTVVDDVIYKGAQLGTDNGDGTTTIQVGDEATGDQISGLAVQVTKVTSSAATWTMKSSSTPAASLKAGEIVMSLTPAAALDTSIVDMYSAINGLDITSKGWVIDEPTIDGTGTAVDAGGEFGISVGAQIAGGAVNDEGEVPVVSVSYTVVPVFE